MQFLVGMTTRTAFLATLLLTPLSLLAIDIEVPGDYPTIQEAMAIAVDGDVIWVQSGYYTGPIDFQGKAVELRSVEGPELTFLVGASSGSVVQMMLGEGPGTLLEGFTLTGGNGTSINGALQGGGLIVVGGSPVISDCIFVENNALVGGGITIRECNTIAPTITGCQLNNNSCIDSGGGIFITESSAGVIISSTTIEANSAGIAGGGLFVETSPLWFSESILEENTASMVCSGMYLYAGAMAICEGSQFIGNEGAFIGGGIVVSYYSGLVCRDSIFTGNVSDLGGAGIAFDVLSRQPQSIVERCIFTDNDGGMSGAADIGVSINDVDLKISHCTFGPRVQWPGGSSLMVAASTPGVVEVVNSIFWAEGEPPIFSPGNQLEVHHCDVIGGYPGSGNIDEDPLFYDHAARDFRLTFGSPCIDIGDPSEGLDPDGSVPDLGAFNDPVAPISPNFLRGDVDGSGGSNISDAVQLLNFLFLPTVSEIGCPDGGDANDSGTLNLADAITILQRLFIPGSPPLPEPVDECGQDPTGDALGCDSGCP
ncbi:MAG TPA: hypothetical protein EYN00_03365 [Planctomycetes bacterium]|nr:hypothetical protein [Planctomycetota bacterium]